MLNKIIEHWYLILIALAIGAIVAGIIRSYTQDPGGNETMFGKNLRQAKKDVKTIIGKE